MLRLAKEKVKQQITKRNKEKEKEDNTYITVWKCPTCNWYTASRIQAHWLITKQLKHMDRDDGRMCDEQLKEIKYKKTQD